MANKPMRVLYVTHEPNLTGASRSLLDLLASLDREKVLPTVLLRRRGPLEDKLADLGIRYDVIPYLLSIKSNKSWKPGFAKRIISFVYSGAVRRYVSQGDYDVVHNNSLLSCAGMRAALENGIPYICHVRELIHESHGMTFISPKSVKFLMNRAAVNIFISRTVSERFSSWAPNSSSKVLWDGVRADGFLGARKKLFSGASVSVVLAGNIAPGKGQMDAIRAIEVVKDRYPNIRLTIVGKNGSDSYATRCRKYIEERHLSEWISFLPFSDNVGALLREADIALCCSQYEALGRSMIEGMLAGCVVIASDGSSARELIRDGVNGFLYRSGSFESLANTMELVIHRQETSVPAALNSRKWATSRFDPGRYADQITEIYRDIVQFNE